jgi:hypothetical protein
MIKRNTRNGHGLFLDGTGHYHFNMMKMGIRGFVVGACALLLTGCSDTIFSNKLTLNLTRVDGLALPVTLPSGTGTIQVVSGTLVGSRFDADCKWTIDLSDGTSPTGTLDECNMDQALTHTIELDLGGPPGPTGPHSYNFGVPTT